METAPALDRIPPPFSPGSPFFFPHALAFSPPYHRGRLTCLVQEYYLRRRRCPFLFIYWGFFLNYCSALMFSSCVLELLSCRHTRLLAGLSPPLATFLSSFHLRIYKPLVSPFRMPAQSGSSSHFFFSGPGSTPRLFSSPDNGPPIPFVLPVSSCKMAADGSFVLFASSGFHSSTTSSIAPPSPSPLALGQIVSSRSSLDPRRPALRTSPKRVL